MTVFHQRHFRSFWKRGLYSLGLVAGIMLVGTVGMHAFEGMSSLDAFYFMSMIATAQGPSVTPATAAGKLFTALMAFVSVGSIVASLGFLFGPFFGRLWRIGVEHLEEEAHRIAEYERERSKRS